MRTVCLKIFFLFFIGISIILPCPTPVLAALVTDIRFWSAPDHTRVVLDLTEPVQYEGSASEKPLRYHLELKEANLFTKKREMEVNDPYLFKVVFFDLGKDEVKLIFYPKKPLSVNVFPLKPYLDKPHRLVIDLVDPAQEKKEEEEREKQKAIRPKGVRTIVIDPGHGGEDPGAIGPQKTMEKDIVLNIGKKLVHLLNQNREIRAFLTRNGDYFIPLEQRMKIAREYGAELFVSLHTDGSFNPQTRGSSIYCLSLSGATDEADRILADKENLSNVLGGAVSKPASVAKDPDRDQILLDLLQNNSMRESFRFAEYLLEDIKTVNHLKFSSFRQANFMVLKAPDIPSVLLEMAYISNKEDEGLLNRDSFQEKMAKALLASIHRYFKQ